MPWTRWAPQSPTHPQVVAGLQLSAPAVAPAEVAATESPSLAEMPSTSTAPVCENGKLGPLAVECDRPAAVRARFRHVSNAPGSKECRTITVLMCAECIESAKTRIREALVARGPVVCPVCHEMVWTVSHGLLSVTPL